MRPDKRGPFFDLPEQAQADRVRAARAQQKPKRPSDRRGPGGTTLSKNPNSKLV